ncbi:MAG: hypothetical protein QW533_03830, partial [Thermoplasmata archaeon]
MVKVIILNPVKKEFEIENVKTVFDILKKLNLNVDGYIALFNGMPIPSHDLFFVQSFIKLGCY